MNDVELPDVVPLGDRYLMRKLTDDDVTVASRWLADKRYYKWLEFAPGKQTIGPLALKVLRDSRDHCIRFVADHGERGLGIVALQHIRSPFRAATLWGLRTHVRPPAPGSANIAIAAMVRLGFEQLGLRSIHAWAVECNRLSIRSMTALGFKAMGRQRTCHVIDDRWYDRILFDLVDEEYFANKKAVSRWLDGPTYAPAPVFDGAGGRHVPTDWYG